LREAVKNGRPSWKRLLSATPDLCTLTQSEIPIHPLKFIWEENAQHLTKYLNFWKQFYRKLPQYREASIMAREFAPRKCVEVGYAIEALEWIELKTVLAAQLLHRHADLILLLSGGNAKSHGQNFMSADTEVF
jgi:hypothetical protein